MKEYEGTVYIGVAASDSVPVKAAMSIIGIERREGDAPPQFISATKGYVGRQMLFNKFMESEHDFLLMLDHDMIFEPDTLEKLRAHKLPYVSGYYLRRQYAPMYSVWFEPFDGQWPLMPFIEEPDQDRLYPIGGSGWGCVLLHRDVVQDTRDKVLKGEWDVIEDDMDVWPYDLEKVMAGDEIITPLRGIKSDQIGSDIRYPFYALAAGYQLMGDASVRPKHILDYPLSPDDFSGQSVAGIAELKREAVKQINSQRKAIDEVLDKMLDNDMTVTVPTNGNWRIDKHGTYVEHPS